MLIKLITLRLLHNPHQFSGVVIDTNGVGEATVCCAWKDKFRKSKLLDPTQALEFGRLYKSPSQHIYSIIFIKDNQTVNRVTQALGFIRVFVRISNA